MTDLDYFVLNNPRCMPINKIGLKSHEVSQSFHTIKELFLQLRGNYFCIEQIIKLILSATEYK